MKTEEMTVLEKKLAELREAGHASEQYLHGFEDGANDVVLPGSRSRGYWRGCAAGEKFRTECEMESANWESS